MSKTNLAVRSLCMLFLLTLQVSPANAMFCSIFDPIDDLLDALFGGLDFFSAFQNVGLSRAGLSSSALPEGLLFQFGDHLGQTATEVKANELASSSGGEVKYIFRHLMKGALITGGTHKNKMDLMKDSDVVLALPDEGVHGEADLRKQFNPPPGLDRIDQSSLPLDHVFQYKWDGSGVRIYILDSGVRTTHREFRGRAPECMFNAFTSPYYHDIDCDDINDHGSHVAGTAAGNEFGVAKNAKIISMKVLDHEGAGSYGGVLAALDVIVGEKRRYPDIPMIANLSLTGPRSDFVNKAVNAAVDAGVVVIVAAGNDQESACEELTPSSAEKVITVAASKPGWFGWGEKRAPYSNYGECIDIFAPGSDVVSAASADDNASSAKSGTSMAAPHVAGAAAMLLQQDPSLSPEEVRQKLIDSSSTDKLSNVCMRGSPNRLLNIGGI